MKKFLGVLFALVMVFALSTKLEAATFSSCQNLLDSTISYAESKGLNGAVPASTGSGNTYGVTYMGSDILFNCVNSKVTYTKSSDYGFTVLQYLVGNVAEKNGKTDVLSYDNFDQILTQLPIAEKDLCKKGFAGTLTSDGEDIQTFIIDANNFGKDTCSTSSSTTETTTKTTETNPKTGVFVPVVGISVLIVASVVCLLWISKKNIYKGF